jgi:intein/homing endonuclease
MQGTLWQWKEPVQGHRYIMGCLTPFEKVMTNNGLKNIVDITNDDKLINEDGDIVNIINKQIYEVINESIYEITVDNTYRTTTFTKEHPILISKPILKRNYLKNNSSYNFNERYWDFDFNYVKAEDVKVNDWVKVPNIYNKIIDIDFDKKWEEDIGNVRSDFKIKSPLQNVDFWWLVGVWLGDGWLQNYKNSFSVHICFNKKEKYYLDKSLEIIKTQFDRNPSIVEKDTTFEIVFNSKELHSFLLKNFNQYSIGKRITEWVKYLPNEYKLNLIKGYFNSDGCWIKTTKKNQINSKISFVSVNLELLESIQDMLFSLGVISSLNKLRNEGKHEINGKTSDTRKCYNLCLAHYDSLLLIKLFNDLNDIKLKKFNIDDFEIKNKRIISSCHLSKDEKWVYFKVKKIKESKYTGNVYNFECDTHTFMCHHITTHNCDVSRGDSEDFSSINIIDFDEREQVLEYIGKMPPDDLASVAYKWGILYDCFIVIDITGGMGIATSRKLQEMNYKSLFIDGVNTQNIWEYNKKAMEKIPGINFNNKRTQIVAAFEEQVRKGFAIRSARLLGELNTFVYINGRPDHMKGAHDDSIMSISMALYVGDISFNQLQRNTSQNKAMMESWAMSERTYEPEKSFYSYGTAFDQIGSMSMDNKNVFNSNNIHEIKQAYQEYSWLFSGYRNRR